MHKLTSLLLCLMLTVTILPTAPALATATTDDDTSTSTTATPSNPAGTIDLQADDIGGKVELEWSVTSGAATNGFKIVKSVKNQNPTYPPLTGDHSYYISDNSAKKHLDRDVRPGQTYNYRVCFFDGVEACTDYSNAISVSLNTDTTATETTSATDEDCADFDKNRDGKIDKYEKSLCRAKNTREHFQQSENTDCKNFDANDDGETDEHDERACRVGKERAKKTDQHDRERTERQKDHIGKQLRPLILELRWGRLNSEDFDENATAVSYTGEIAITSGEGRILHPIAFEENDAISSEEGELLSWESQVGGHFDGLLVRIKPDKPEFDENGELLNGERALTLTLGSFSKALVVGGEENEEFYGSHDLGDGNQLEIRNISHLKNAPKYVSDATADRLLEHKTKISEKLDDAGEQFRRLHDNKRVSDQVYDQFDDVRESISDYNFYGQGADDMQERLVELIATAQDEGLSATEIAKKIVKLQRDFAAAKKQALEAKFAAGLVSFKDVDDSEWYGSFVTYAKDNSIASGYQGDRAGEYGPGDSVTVGEILKMALEAADHGEADSEDARYASHWAKKYFRKAKDLGLSFGGTAQMDPNRGATRGEVANLVLEALGIIPPAVTTAPFADVPTTHQYAAAIAYLKDAGVISGDSAGDTFRPDAGINRAEVAKIIQNMIEVLKDNL